MTKRDSKVSIILVQWGRYENAAQDLFCSSLFKPSLPNMPDSSILGKTWRRVVWLKYKFYKSADKYLVEKRQDWSQKVMIFLFCIRFFKLDE